MAALFAASELINIAIREEETGATFYRALAENTDSEELSEFALTTAAMEEEHAEKFRQLLRQVGDYRPQGEQHEGEYGEYLAYLLEGRIFPVGDESRQMAARQRSDREAVETAREMEKNTLLLYQELSRFVPEGQRGVLEGIMDEERLHLLQFTRFKEEHM